MIGWPRRAGACCATRGRRCPGSCRGSGELPAQLRALGVTGREAERFLGLVARGLANREIAEQMFLSPRTVEKHVASLLAKTGTRRRAQLAGYFSGLAT